MDGIADGDNHLAELDALRRENARLRTVIVSLRQELNATHQSTSWRVTAPVRSIASIVGAMRRGRRKATATMPLNPDGYRAWCQKDDAERRRRAEGKQPTGRISLLMPVRGDDVAAIAASVAALRGQVFQDWQLCIVDAASAAATVAGALAVLTDDPRIRIRRMGQPDLTAALDAALAMSDGLTIGLLCPGDVLPPDALTVFARLFQDRPDVVAAYADEDRIDEAGARYDPRFKSGWSPDLLLSDPAAIGRAWMVRRTTLTEAGGFAGCQTGAEDYDCQLRVTRTLPDSAVAHIPHILWHAAPISRCDPDAAATAALTAARTEDPNATLLPVPMGHWFAWSKHPALVSVIVPTRDRADLLAGTADAVLAERDLALELIVVDNGSQDPETTKLFDALRRDDRVHILPLPGPFNWSALNNAAVRASRGDVLLLLNNDIAAMEPGWLASLAAEAMRPTIGIAGAKLLYPDGTVQHAGLWLGPNCGPFHLLRHAARDEPGYLGQLALPRDLLAVTGACLAIRRTVFDQLGGLDEGFPVAYNDIDLCLRAVAAGYRVLWTPHVRLYHLESASRGDPNTRDRQAAELRAYERFRDTWHGKLGRDPFFNANLDRDADGQLVLVHPHRSE